MTTREATQLIMRRLTSLYGADEAQAMMRDIMLAVVNYSPVDIVLREQSELPEFAPRRLQDILERLERHEPLQYVLGTARFHGMDFKVTPSTLIPRPETELLVDMIVDDCGDRTDLRVLDIGTGSGCIAIALARALRFPTVDAIDISEQALAVARDNASRLKATVNFRQADVLAPRINAGSGLDLADLEQCVCPTTAGGGRRVVNLSTYDIIVSNPPYVMQSEAATMDANVLDYEPHSALFVPDDDPLLFYRAIATLAMTALTPHDGHNELCPYNGGRLYLEINPLLANETLTLLKDSGFTDCRLHRDQYGRLRFATATRPSI